MADGKQITGKAAEAILTEARARFKLAIDAEKDNRQAALDDLKFLNGEQWEEAATKVRKNRPCLTINRLPQYVRQVVNEQRKTRPAIDVIPADGKAAKPTAEVIQGIVRYIERTSRSRIAYDTAFEYAVACGFGHFRVCTDYVDDEGFDQEIRIESIANPFTVYSDPRALEPDYADSKWRFVTTLWEPDAFEDKYGFEPTAFKEAGTGDDVADWFEDDDIRVAEYWRIVEEEEELHALSDGSMVSGKADEDELGKLGITIKNTRTKTKRTVESYVLTYDKVIQKNEWLGKYIPIVTSVGGMLNIAGDRKITSLIRFAKDPARMYNYLASAEVELTALQPKAPWIAADGSFAGKEASWARANTDNQPYLEYIPIEGQPPPQRQFFAGVPAGVREGRMAAAEDIKATLGMYDASLGAKSNETSGIAIKARQQEGDTGTFHFIDNHARAIEQCGRIIIDLIPKVYDMPRAVRILGPNDEEDLVKINEVFIDPKTGQEHLHDMQLGRYEVAVRVGPSFESKRQEQAQAMIELGARNPKLFDIAGDLFFKSQEWPQSDEIAKRLYMLLPPQLKGEQGPPPVDPMVQAEQAKAQAQMQIEQGKAQVQMQIKQMETQLASQQDQGKQAFELEKLRLQTESAERIAAMNNASKNDLELAKLAEERALQIHVQDREDARTNAKLNVEQQRVHADVQIKHKQLDSQNQSEQSRMQHERSLAGAKEPQPDKPDSMQMLAEQMGHLVHHLSKPKRIIRGPDGKAMGVE